MFSLSFLKYWPSFKVWVNTSISKNCLTYLLFFFGSVAATCTIENSSGLDVLALTCLSIRGQFSSEGLSVQCRQFTLPMPPCWTLSAKSSIHFIFIASYIPLEKITGSTPLQPASQNPITVTRKGRRRIGSQNNALLLAIMHRLPRKLLFFTFP